MQFDAIWNDVLGLGAAEKSLNIIRTLNGAFWRYLKRCFGSLNCWKKMGTLNGAFWRYLKRCFGSWNSCENFEVNDANWSVLILFKTLLFFLSWNCCEKMRIRPFYAAFWCNLNRCFGSWNCWEIFEIKDAKRCILTLFETSIFLLLCSHLKVISFWGFQFKSLLERVYVMPRAWFR